jgi:hypothetical protein
MPTYPPDVVEIIRRLEARILRLERTQSNQVGTITQPTGGSLDITNLSLTSSVALDAFGFGRATVTATWDDVEASYDPDDIMAPKVDHYEVQWKPVGFANWTAAGTTQDEAYTLYNLQLSLAIEVRVRVRTKAAVYGPWSTQSITTANDITVPNQPSTPTVASWVSSLRITWNGLTATGGSMPIDLDRVEIHVSTTNGFTPTALSLVGNFFVGGGSFTYGNVVVGNTYYVKLVAVDNAGNKSPSSTQVSATISGLVQQNFDRELQNILTEKSYYNFEDPSTANLWQKLFSETDPQWLEANSLTGETGGRIRLGTTSQTSRYVFGPYLPVNATALYRLRIRYRTQTQGTGDVYFGWMGYAGDKVTYVNAAGANGFTSQHYHTEVANLPGVSGTIHMAEGFSQGYGTTAGTGGEAPNPQLPGTFHPNVKYIRPYLILSNGGNSTVVDVLALEIEVDRYPDNIIGRAQIADLAVNNAKIADLEVGKLTAGTLSADILLASSIATGTSGARTEMNNSGFYGYNTSGLETFSVSSVTGAVLVSGHIQTGIGNAHVVIDDMLYRGRPAIQLNTGSTDGLQPVIQSIGAEADGYDAGALVINGREATVNSTGRADLQLKHGGNFSLKQIYGTTGDECGIEKTGDFLYLHGRHAGASQSSGKELFTAGTLGHGTVAAGVAVSTSVSYAIAAPTTRRVYLTMDGSNAGALACHTHSLSSTGFGYRFTNIGSVSISTVQVRYLTITT